jgi:hypothetical protein
MSTMMSPGGYRTPTASYLLGSPPASTFSTALAGGNKILAAVQNTRASPPPAGTYLRLDANRRDREKELSSALVAQISHSPYARTASPAPILSAFMSSSMGSAPRMQQLSLDRTGSSSFVAPPRSPGAAATRAAAWPGTYPRPGRVENRGATYLAYLVEERKRLHAQPGVHHDLDLDVDLEQLSRQAVIDEAALRHRPLALPPAEPAPVSSASDTVAGVGASNTTPAPAPVASEPPAETGSSDWRQPLLVAARGPEPEPTAETEPMPEPSSVGHTLDRFLASLKDADASAVALNDELPPSDRHSESCAPTTTQLEHYEQPVVPGSLQVARSPIGDTDSVVADSSESFGLAPQLRTTSHDNRAELQPRTPRCDSKGCLYLLTDLHTHSHAAPLISVTSQFCS